MLPNSSNTSTLANATSLPYVQEHAALTRLNTLALPAVARRLLTIRSINDARMFSGDPAFSTLRNEPRFIVGGGSNLVLNGDFEGLVLHSAIAGRRLVAEDADAWYVEGGAGENWHEFVLWTLKQGWPGLENLVLIPGTVGAVPIQNIGAYGLEVAERFHSATAIDLNHGTLHNFDSAACRFGYRDSVFKQNGWHCDGRMLIVAVSFRLPKRWQPVTRYADVANELATRTSTNAGDDSGNNSGAEPSALDVANAVITIRQRKLPDPMILPNAGSFFHNPIISAELAMQLKTTHPQLPQYPQNDGRIKLAAGWLIEQAGWKGRQLGPVGMYEKQALVLVNHGGATGADVRALAAAVQADVLARFGVALHPEPISLGGG